MLTLKKLLKKELLTIKTIKKLLKKELFYIGFDIFFLLIKLLIKNSFVELKIIKVKNRVFLD